MRIIVWVLSGLHIIWRMAKKRIMNRIEERYPTNLSGETSFFNKVITAKQAHIFRETQKTEKASYSS